MVTWATLFLFSDPSAVCAPTSARETHSPTHPLRQRKDEEWAVLSAEESGVYPNKTIVALVITVAPGVEQSR